MPIIYPQVTGIESADINQRIINKYDEYRKLHDAGGCKVQLLGERYEITSIMMLHEKLLFTNGRQISRWHSRGETPQSISIGSNTEYDFIIPSSKSIRRLKDLTDTGPVLGEAKSYTDGLGEYIKKSIGYCLNDPTLGGFCFVTPGDDYKLFLQLTHETISILAGVTDTPAITGGNSWQGKSSEERLNKPSGKEILSYFRNKYYSEKPKLNHNNQIEVLQNTHAASRTGYINYKLNDYTKRVQPEYYQRKSNRAITALYFNEELSTKAGFVVACYQVKNKDHDKLTSEIQKIKILNSNLHKTALL